jgi:hypothetical protein
MSLVTTEHDMYVSLSIISMYISCNVQYSFSLNVVTAEACTHYWYIVQYLCMGRYCNCMAALSRNGNMFKKSRQQNKMSIDSVDSYLSIAIFPTPHYSLHTTFKWCDNRGISCHQKVFLCSGGGGGGACLLVTVFLMVPPGESTDISLVSVANSSQDFTATLYM